MRFLRPKKPRSDLTVAASSDAERRARAEAAFDAENRRLYPIGLRYALSELDDQDDATDAVQEALVALWRVAYEDGDLPDEPMDTLFFQILRRKITDVWRGALRRQPYDDQHAADIGGNLYNTTDTRLVAEGSLLSSRLAYAVAALPPKMRMAVEAFARIGDRKAIAGELGISPAAAKWNLDQGVARLRQQLGNEYHLPAPVPRGRSGGRTK
jgi:DNA-directed RNA polymerase specialized sigma24 family protein